MFQVMVLLSLPVILSLIGPPLEIFRFHVSQGAMRKPPQVVRVLESSECRLLAHVGLEHPLAKANAFRRDLNQLVIRDVLERFLEAHRFDWRE
jgi:hypothetical protein